MNVNVMESRKIRYLLAGGWNTLFGYCLVVWLYAKLSSHLHIILISVLANVCAISMSFVTYKLLVFKTKGQWLSEYLRCYVVYGGTAVLGVLMLWVMVDGLGILFWIAQGICVLTGVLISFIGHERITFNRFNNKRSMQ